MNTSYRYILAAMVWLIYYCKVPNRAIFFWAIYQFYLISKRISKLKWRYTVFKRKLTYAVYLSNLEMVVNHD